MFTDFQPVRMPLAVMMAINARIGRGMKKLSLCFVSLVMMALAGCERSEAPPPATAAASGAPMAAPVPQPPQSGPSPDPAAASTPPISRRDWLGHWTGVEGTYLNLTTGSTPNQVWITLADLDGPKRYAGTLMADGIHFERNGQTVKIRAGTGDDTGMKWLAGKTNCLVVVAGQEGFCRE